ncbi:predicted protein [Nematostella vectensis]|uniref:ALMS motif domain-containing protein n=1 Tax=Nematostella vectensis TaxID=45351 RepID=A7SQ81_NEMVE|nr:predicted protein [Nematostella vectensis]|eukprot:XP_001626219.1 predicted protein [Nematostella vectensis]
MNPDQPPSDTNNSTEQEYNTQWHILEQLKSSVAAPELAGSTEVAERMATLPVDASGHSSSEPVMQGAGNNPGDDPYQEQWHVLEQLKASVKALHWSGNSSPDTLSKSPKIRKYSDQFTEPRLQDLEPQTTGYSSKSLNPNSSSDLSLESDALGFVSLPNRPATIGNYGASDSPPYSKGMPINLQAAYTASSDNGTKVSMQRPEPNTQASMSKSPLSARERLQPDGRDGPDSCAVPVAVTLPGGSQGVPVQPLPAYLSTTSVTDLSGFPGQTPDQSVSTYSLAGQAMDGTQSVILPAVPSPSSHFPGVSSTQAYTPPYQLFVPSSGAAPPGDSSGLGVSVNDLLGGMQTLDSNLLTGVSFPYAQGSIYSQASNYVISPLAGGSDVKESSSHALFDSHFSEVLHAGSGIAPSPPTQAWGLGSRMQSYPTSIWQDTENGIEPTHPSNHQQDNMVSSNREQQQSDEYETVQGASENILIEQELESPQEQSGSRTSSRNSDSLSNLLVGSKNSSPVDREVMARVQEITNRYLGSPSESSTSQSASLNGSPTERPSSDKKVSIDGFSTSHTSLKSPSPVTEVLMDPTGLRETTGITTPTVTSTFVKSNYSQVAATTFPVANSYVSSAATHMTRQPARTTIVNKLHAGLMDSEDDVESPVSKLLGPQFRATQDYLNKLKQRGLESTSSAEQSEKDFYQGNSLYAQQSFTSAASFEPYTTKPKDVSSDSLASSVPSVKQAWIVSSHKSLPEYVPHGSTGGASSIPCSPELTDASTYSNSSLILRAPGVKHTWSEDSHERRSDIGESGMIALEKNASTSLDESSTHAYCLRPSVPVVPEPNTIVPEGMEIASRHSVLQTSTPDTGFVSSRRSDTSTGIHLNRQQNAFGSVYNSSEASSAGRNEMPARSSSLSSFETPLTSYVPTTVSAQNSSSRGRESFSSNTIVSSHDEAEDTDDLLSYEAALEGDLKYFRQLKSDSKSKTPPVKDRPFTSSVDSTKIQTGLNGDISSITGSVHRPDLDKATRQFHMSLGAGSISPLTESEVGTLRKSDQVLRQYQDENKIPSYLESRGKDTDRYSSNTMYTPTPESSSSSLYKPHLHHQDPMPTGTSGLVGQEATHGLYDVRHSSGPGSTNRRRRAMGLSPRLDRVSRTTEGEVYVSADSTPFDLRDEGGSDTTTTSKDDESDPQLSKRRSATGSRSSKEKSLYRPDSRKNSSVNSSINKHGSARNRSHQDTKSMLDDYVVGRRSVQAGDRELLRRDRSSNGSHGTEYTTRKSKELNDMWERFQESLRSSPSYTKKGSVSSHLDRLSTLLAKPLLETTGSSSVSDPERGNRAKSEAPSTSYYSSDASSDLTQLNEGFIEFMRNPSFSQQIRLRKLLETVNIANVPTFPRLRRTDTTTTSTSTESDTSTSETFYTSEHDAAPVVMSRPNRGSRKVSRTPVLEPSHRVKTTAETKEILSKCICSKTQVKDEQVRGSRATQTSHTRDVAVNVPTPKHRALKERKPSKSGRAVDVGVQTHLDSDLESPSVNRIHSSNTDGYPTRQDSPDRTTKSKHKQHRKDRLIAGHNSPVYRAYQENLSSSEKENSLSSEHSYSPGKHQRRQGHKERIIASQNSPAAKIRTSHNKEPNDSGPAWFYPVSNKHYSRPSDSESMIQPANLRRDDQTTKTFSPPAAAVSTSMQRLSLQEAFNFAKPDFVSRSRARLNRIGRNRVVRERGEVTQDGEQRVTKMEIPVKGSGEQARKPNQAPRKTHLPENNRVPRPRRLSKKEMRELNQKLYNNLPEVKAQKDENKRAAFYKTNRLKAQLYDKRVRDRLKKRYSA